MSRIGRLPIAIPKGVEVQAAGRTVTVKGPKGSLSLELRGEVELDVQPKELVVRPNGKGGAIESRAYHGMTRALLGNMVTGVTKGYEKVLEIVGVGWNASGQGRKLTLNIGFCHPIVFEVPAGIEVETPKPVEIYLRGADKQAVGQFAATIRSVRPPEPYKGKGIRYRGEHVRRKAGKSFGS